MRLFRQVKTGRWQDVFERMAAEIEEMGGTGRSTPEGRS